MLREFVKIQAVCWYKRRIYYLKETVIVVVIC